MIEISIMDNFIPMATDIYITNKIGTTRQFLQPDGSWVAVEINELIRRDDVKPTMRLPMDLGRELLNSLMNHYHGADDARALRRDYDEERKRVDRLTAAMIEIAKDRT